MDTVDCEMPKADRISQTHRDPCGSTLLILGRLGPESAFIPLTIDLTGRFLSISYFKSLVMEPYLSTQKVEAVNRNRGIGWNQWYEAPFCNRSRDSSFGGCHPCLLGS